MSAFWPNRSVNSFGNGANGSIIPVLAQYLGQVGGQMKKPQSFAAAGSTQMMIRSPHWVRAGCTNPVFRFPNWYVSGTTFQETAPGGIATVSAAVEYPIGVTSTPIKWSGSSTHAIADGSWGAESDACPVTIPPNSKVIIRTYYTNPAGLVFFSGTADGANNAELRFAVSGLADQTTAVGTLTGGTFNPSNTYTPLIFAAQTTRPSILILGDSRAEGSQAGEGFVGTSSDKGNVARCIGPYFGYSDMSKASDTSTNFLASNTQRLAQLAYFSHVINEYGVNGVTTAGTGAAEYARCVSIKALLGGKKCFQTTLEPWTTSSDGWTTGTGQTINAAKAGRVDFNTLVKANSGSFAGYFDFTSISEPNADQLWAFSGGPFTADGVHPNTAMDISYLNGGIINPALFT